MYFARNHISYILFHTCWYLQKIMICLYHLKLFKSKTIVFFYLCLWIISLTPRENYRSNVDCARKRVLFHCGEPAHGHRVIHHWRHRHCCCSSYRHHHCHCRRRLSRHRPSRHRCCLHHPLHHQIDLIHISSFLIVYWHHYLHC